MATKDNDFELERFRQILTSQPQPPRLKPNEETKVTPKPEPKSDERDARYRREIAEMKARLAEMQTPDAEADAQRAEAARIEAARPWTTLAELAGYRPTVH